MPGHEELSRHGHVGKTGCRGFNMIKAEKSLFLPQGRINRKSIAYRSLGIFFILGFVMANMILTNSSYIFPILMTAGMGQVFLAIQVIKRFHDAGRPGKYAWITLIPAFGFLYAFYSMTLEEQKGENKYGKAPFPEKIILHMTA